MGLVFEAVLATGMRGDDGHVEGVRLAHDPVAAQELALGHEADAVDFATEPREQDLEFDSLRRQRHAVAADPGVILGWHAAFKDGEFEREAAVLQQAAAVRPGRGLVGVLIGVLICMLICMLVVNIPGTVVAGARAEQ
jgi:hypothetical protein